MKSRLNKTFCFTLLSAIVLSSGSVQGQQPRDLQRRPITANRQAAPNRQAQAPVRRAPAGPVRVVDISYIFQNHLGFKATMEEMKKEVKAYEDTLRARHKALSDEKDRLKDFRPGSPDYEAREKAIAKKAAELQIDSQLKKKNFLDREAKVYYRVYAEVTRAIQDYADMNNISLVLRFNGDRIDPENRNSVLQGVNRAVVYQRSLDITREILDRLNRSSTPISRKPVNSRAR